MYANESLMKIIWNGIIQVINGFNKNIPLPSSKDIQKAINESDVELAKKIIEGYGVSVKEYSEPTSIFSRMEF